MKKHILPIIILFCFLYAPLQAQEMQGYRNPAADDRFPLTEAEREASVEALQATLYELISQRHAVQQAHWNVQGPLFYSLHDLLGHFYEAINPKIDMIAERLLVLNVPADGRPEMVAEGANLESVPEGYMDDQQVPDFLSTRYKTISDRLSERIETTSDDLVTQDMLIGTTTMVDDHLWKLRAFQR
jgi:starvation-inducible DNA-binding protein